MRGQAAPFVTDQRQQLVGGGGIALLSRIRECA
jgi:hypothetical protein